MYGRTRASVSSDLSEKPFGSSGPGDMDPMRRVEESNSRGKPALVFKTSCQPFSGTLQIRRKRRGSNAQGLSPVPR